MDRTILTIIADWTRFLNDAEYELLSIYNRTPDLELEIPLSVWQDELGRLQVWEIDFGASQLYRASLDDRLQKHPLVKDQVLRQLTRVRRLFEDLKAESYSPEEQELDTENEDTDEPQDEAEEGIQGDVHDQMGQPRTAIQDIYMHLEDSINDLNQTSTIVAQRANVNLESRTTGKSNTTLPSHPTPVSQHFDTNPRTKPETKSGSKQPVRPKTGSHGNGSSRVNQPLDAYSVLSMWILRMW
ncbi:hypothetical protein BJX70DRAFT_177536 [Aspergillus crustosus]